VVCMQPCAGHAIAGIGGLLSWRSAAAPPDEAVLNAHLELWAGALDLRLSNYPGPLAPLRRKFRGGLQRAALAVALVALCSIGGWPVYDRVSAEIYVEVAAQRIVSSPFASLLDSVSVRAGDEVAAGQLLARLDGRHLELQRTQLDAERKQLVQQESSQRAAGHLETAYQARLEMSKVDAQLALLEQRLGQLEITSPIAGVVLTAGLEKELGRALTLGQPLLEVVPLDNLRGEIRILSADIARLPGTATLHFTLDALPSREFAATVSRIRPRAEVSEGSSYFVAEVELDNDARELRPVMRGRAAIIGEKTRLAWRFLRAPVDAIKRWRGW
jgi:multidrug efflux pump subunit AcrA (membrane-fusion protein)